MSARSYIEYIILAYLKSSVFDGKVTKRWMPLEDLREQFAESGTRAFEDFGFDVGDRYREIGIAVYDSLISSKVIKIVGDEFTSEHGYLEISEKDDTIDKVLENSPASKNVEVLGSDILGRVVQRLAKTEGWLNDLDDGAIEAAVVSETMTEIPASDRIVTLSHNQTDPLEKDLSAIISEVEKQNQLGESLGIREIIVGQLKAGRELLRVGSFKIYLLQLTLLDSLSFLAKRYEKEAIGALASALMTALIAALGMAK